MYGRIYQSDIEKMKGLPKGALLIYAVLINRGGSRREVTISQSDLSSCSGLSLRLVSKAITDLRNRQVIQVTRRGKKLSNIYRLCDANETFVSVESDTNKFSASHASDTNKTCKSDTNESFVSIKEKNTIDNYNYNSIAIGENEKSIIEFLNSNWNWEISIADYQRLREEYSLINHRLELMSIDAWNRRRKSENKHVWPKQYALKSMRAWFDNISKEAAPFRDSFPRSVSAFVVPLSLDDKKISSNPSPAGSWIKAEDSKHRAALEGAPKELLEAFHAIEIGRKDIERSVDLFWRIKPRLSEDSKQYLLQHQDKEMFSFYAIIAGEDR